LVRGLCKTRAQLRSPAKREACAISDLEKGKWRPGQSGNPRGRPPNASCLTALLTQELANTCSADQKGRTWKELIVEAMMRLAIKGNSTAINTVFERIEGKVKDEVDHSGTVKVVEIPATAADEDDSQLALVGSEAGETFNDRLHIPTVAIIHRQVLRKAEEALDAGYGQSRKL